MPTIVLLFQPSDIHSWNKYKYQDLQYSQMYFDIYLSIYRNYIFALKRDTFYKPL